MSPTETFTYDADNEAFLKKLSQSEAVNKRVQDTIVRDAEKARARERIAAATEADVQKAIHEKLSRQMIAEEEKRSKAILREKEKAGKEQLKLLERQAREERKARDKALAEEEKKRQAGTFSGKARAIQQSPVISEAETIASLGITAGGSISKLSMLVTSAIRPLALLGAGISSLGPAGIAAAAGIAAVAAPLAAGGVVLSGLKSMANGALEAQKQLANLGKRVSGEETAALGQYADATRDLGIAMDRVTVAIGTGPARELALFATLLADSTARIYAEGKAAAELAGILTNTLTVGASYVAKALGTDLYEALTADQRAFVEAKSRAEDLTQSLQIIAMQSKLTAAAIKGANDKAADEDAAEGARQQAKADEEARKALVAMAEASRLAADERTRLVAEVERGLEYTEKEEAAAKELRIAESRRLALLWQLQNVATDPAMLDAMEMLKQKVTEIDVELQKPINRLRELGGKIGDWLNDEDVQATIGGITALIGATADLFQMQADRAVEALGRISDRQDKLREANAEFRGEEKKLANAAAKASDAATKKYYQDQLDQLASDKETNDTKLKNSQDRAEAERKILIRSFNLMKAASITETIINGAVALVKAFATLGPIAGGIAAAGIAAGTGVAIAKIASQKPPEAPIGRPPASSPDHPVRVAIQNEEAVLSKQGVRTLGGGSGVTAANNGTLGGDLEVQNVQNVYVENLILRDRGGRDKKVDRNSGKGRGRKR